MRTQFAVRPNSECGQISSLFNDFCCYKNNIVKHLRVVQKINIRRRFGGFEISDKIPVDWWRFHLNQVRIILTVDLPTLSDFESLKILSDSKCR